MAGETIGAKSAFTSIVSAASVASAAFTAESTSILAALAASVEDYPFLDFQVVISSGTPSATGILNVYRRSKADGTNKEPAPSASNKRNFVGQIALTNAAATSYYYLLGVENADNEATYYAENSGGATLTLAVLVRGRTYKAAA